jgi:hypothetical protein
MKTEAIQRLINDAEEARAAALELNALEESHADMARALMAFVDAADNGLPTDLPRLDHGAREALRKAGVIK